MQRVLSTVVLLGLLVATAAAFAITEHLKLIKSPIYAPIVTKSFSPVCHCATGNATISFRLRHSDRVTVTIVDGGGNIVDTVRTDVPEQKGAVATFPWDGHTTTGIAPNGSVYQPQVELSKDPRTILMPNKILVDTAAPKVISASAGAGVLIAGGHHGIAIRYEFSEKAHARLYLRGQRVLFGRRTRPRDKIKWNGKASEKALRPGRYVLEVAAVDLAGNETPPSGRKRVVVTVRDIALSETSIHVAAGASFSVKVRTGALKYSWTLAGKHGTGTKKVLHLRAPAHHGRYRLVVSEHGQSAAAVVIVGKA